MDAQTENAIARLPELIEMRLDWTEVLTTGTNVNTDEDRFVIEADIASRTPIVFWFGELRLVCYCQSGATVGMDLVTNDFDLTKYFGEDELFLLGDEEDMGIVRCPFAMFLDGRNGGFITAPEPWVEKFVLIYRELGEEFDGLAAFLIDLDNKVQFGLTAIQGTNFTYLFNDQCKQLQTEAEASEKHRVVEIQPKTPRKSEMTGSLLWLVE